MLLIKGEVKQEYDFVGEIKNNQRSKMPPE